MKPTLDLLPLFSPLLSCTCFVFPSLGFIDEWCGDCCVELGFTSVFCVSAISGRPLMKFESGYSVETVFDGSKLGIEPYSVEVLPSGDLLVLDSANSNLYKISSSLSLCKLQFKSGLLFSYSLKYFVLLFLLADGQFEKFFGFGF